MTKYKWESLTDTKLAESKFYKENTKITASELRALANRLLDIDWNVNGVIVNLRKAGWFFRWTEMMSVLGQCDPRDNAIELSIKMVKINTGLAHEWEDTIRHEIAHAIDFHLRGKSDHGRIWKRICSAVTRARPNRCSTYKGWNLGHRYEIVCDCCERVFGKFIRRPKMNRYLNRYCARCGPDRGKLKLEDLKGKPVAVAA